MAPELTRPLAKFGLKMTWMLAEDKKLMENMLITLLVIIISSFEYWKIFKLISRIFCNVIEELRVVLLKMVQLFERKGIVVSGVKPALLVIYFLKYFKAKNDIIKS